MRSTTTKIIWMAAFLVIVLALMTVPNFIKSRNVSSINACPNNLRQIDAAKEQAALAYQWDDGVDCDDPTNKAVVNQYIKGNTCPVCTNGGKYSYNRLGQNPTCSYYRADDVSASRHYLP